MDIEDHKVMRAIEPMLDQALHRTDRMDPPNLRLNVRLYFRKNAKNGKLWAGMNFEDEHGRIVDVNGDTRIPLSPGRDDPAETVGWYFEQIARRAFERVERDAT